MDSYDLLNRESDLLDILDSSNVSYRLLHNDFQSVNYFNIKLGAFDPSPSIQRAATR